MTDENKGMENWLELSNVQTYTRGDILAGTVLQVTDTAVLVDIGYKSEAIMNVTEIAPFRDGQLQSGEKIDVLVTYIDEEEGTVYVSERQAVYEKRIGELEESYRAKEPVTGVIEGEVKNAGYHVNLLGVRAFLPGSQLGKDLPADIDSLRGQEIQLRILELDRRDKNLVVSRKALIQEIEKKERAEFFTKVETGQVIEGTIKSIVDYGLFVDIGGFEGLVHRTEISWKEVPVPPKTYNVGDTAEVKVLEIDKEKERIRLSIKQLRPDPWDEIEARYQVGSKHNGTVVSITDFGAFIRLEDDVEGLVHISELSWGYPQHPKDVVSENDAVEVVVLECSAAKRRISLSMRQAQSDPWSDVENRYPEGSTITGKVTKLAPFGAFIQLESGVEALLHISEMSWEHVTDPAQVCKEGDEVEAKVIKSDSAHRKIRLSLRELQEDPWHKFVENFSVNEEVEGLITELKDFGAFVKITDEVEGLIHVSEIAEERIGHPSDILEVNQTIQARIIGINEERRQVRLSMRKPREIPEKRPPARERKQEAREKAPAAPKEYTTEGSSGSLTLREHLEQKENTPSGG